MKIMLLKSFLLVGAIMCFGLAKAQTVSGNVSDANGPLLGASVVVKGTANGTTADFDGNFTINAGSGDTLVFSYVGYTAQEVVVGNQTTINVVLVANNELDEVIVTGYGGQKEKEITSAVVAVSEEEFNQGVVNDAAGLVQGKVAGLQIYNKGGNPNSGAQIRLRGLSTVGANSSPLVVIDGVIGASLANVDPTDIASINVLKDASAAAIYGSRGSSGVILVTTKKGVAGETKISYNVQYSNASRLNTIDLMSPDEFLAAGGRDLGSRTDWLDEVTRTAASTIHNISMAGGAGSTSYRVSANYRDVEGILQNNGFTQMNARLNFSTRTLNDKLKIEFSSSFTDRDQKNGFNEALRYATLYNPTAPVFAADAPYAFNGEQFGGYFETLGLFDSFNPVSIINQNINDGKKVEYNYSANFTYNLTDNFDLHFNAANQLSKYNNRLYYRGTSLWNGGAASPSRKGSATFYNDEYSFQLYEAYATWNKSFGNSNVVLTGGYSYQKQNFNSHSVTVGDFPNNDFDYINAIELGQDLLNQGFVGANSDMAPDNEIEAYFLRANVTIADNFFVNASLRREGSTKLGDGNKYGTFPAIGLGTDLNKYLNLEGVNQLKARVSYGVTGNLPAANGLSQEVRGFAWAGGGTSGGTTSLVRAANPDLKWEEKSETNFGIDLNTDRLTASLDIYSQTSKDFILERQVDATVFGFDRRWENAGQVTSKGVELAVNYDLIQNDGFTYNTGVVWSTNETVLDEYVSEQERFANLGAPGQNDTYAIRVKVGEEIGQIYAPVWDGTVTNGSQNFVDVNGDGVINTNQANMLNDDADFAVVGRGTPDFELGWTNQLTFGDWSVNAFFRGAFGHSLVNTFRVFYEPRVGSQKSYNYINTELANPEITNAQFSSLYVEKADFFKLDNLTVARKLNLNSGVIDNATLSLNVQNAFVLTKYTGSDPEPSLSDNGNVLAPGMDRRNNYYSARTFTVGLNINF
ncbi:MAG: TonB-dependent receptor SusC [SAR116 cluster bacterium]|jgi:iron complex outermembrane receptor protein|nr:MAG: TonB-dependent receptor SusC [SAR116 cluster bacterium]